MRGWIVRIAIIGVIVLGGLVFRERLSGSAGDLAVGDCFDVPAGDTNIGDVQHHPCTEAHTGEVFALVKNPAAKGAPSPTEAELVTFLTTQCGAVFSAYTGINVDGQDILDYGAFYPSDNDWNDGQRGVTCYVYRTDEGAMTSSIRKAP